jgi:hypothetical protein
MHQLDTLHIYFYFIKTQSLDMFQVSLAHPQEALTITREQSASITAHYTHQNFVCVVPPEDGQVMPKTCRGFEF